MGKKGRGLEFINGQESFDKIFVSKIDNRLRNAIGHRSYTYDIDTQKLTYYPSGSPKKGKAENLYLTEFVLECFQLMRSCIGLAEIIYQTRKIIYINQGIKPRELKDYFNLSIKESSNSAGTYNKKSQSKKRR